jgi:hypothetical protein
MPLIIAGRLRAEDRSIITPRSEGGLTRCGLNAAACSGYQKIQRTENSNRRSTEAARGASQPLHHSHFKICGTNPNRWNKTQHTEAVRVVKMVGCARCPGAAVGRAVAAGAPAAYSPLQ